ncbi:MAG: ACP S-malonyltransferase [Candidatus Lumbricidophila eiseniae]|uniref:[acyl-carrier-protein] S-malonyltransferase n=1 Tax=Candidatus Lumbricidiphila eiseniae TaxID=1969409 RepID=A0A2A6FSE2_9MICO|nr:MAG: ACP S-malonyltransferase [Candidatus Lumbricidophila eiseniae]
MIAIVCPGQGSQTPGFLTPWLAEARFADSLAELSDAAGIDLTTHGTVSDADTIRDTAVAQPLIVAAGILTLTALLTAERRSRIGGIVGHSVGEFTAAVGAGVLSPADAMHAVAVRGQAMADASALTPTGMSAVLSTDRELVLARLAELDLAPANINGGGQIVAAGAIPALTTLKEAPPTGARVIPLQVAGAFHTRYMSSAVPVLADALTAVVARDPSLPLWTNSDGSLVNSGQRFSELLVAQVAAPVRWDLCMASLLTAGITGVIELAPAGALAGLIKRELPGIPVVAVKTPDEFAAAAALIDGDSG